MLTSIYIKMKIYHALALFLCLILCSCLTEYEATDIDQIADVLVIEGIITDDVTFITLSRSMNLTNYLYSNEFSDMTLNYAHYARVYVECDDDTVFPAENLGFSNNGQYTIKTGKLEPERRYRLKIEMDEPDPDCSPSSGQVVLCPSKTCVYFSDFLYPIQTPEIDSIFWSKRIQGQQVNIHVSTRSTNNKMLYYRWSYKEDWEIRPEIKTSAYPDHCWATSINTELLLGSAERTVGGRVTEVLTGMMSSNPKLSQLYRIDVKQNAISKRAYDYFANIKKNAELSGSLFAPVPSELRGNISCITYPEKPVIGYIDVSLTTYKRRYIYRYDGAYERPRTECGIYTREELCTKFDLFCNSPPSTPPWLIYNNQPVTYVHQDCVECPGTPYKPEDWPDLVK